MPEKALDLFEEMHLNLENATYTIAFSACAQLSNDRAKKLGKKLLDQMPDNFRNNNVVLTSAIHMLIRLSDVKGAECVFGTIKKKSTVTYGTMMNGYNQNNDPLKCIKRFEEMKQQDIVPDEIIFMLLIGACSQVAMFSLCQSVVAQIPLHFYDKPRIYNSLIDMWASISSSNSSNK